jgi:hypothetical protein
MAQRTRVELQGFEEFDRALRDLPAKMQKSVIRSGMRGIAKQLQEGMSDRVARSKVHDEHLGDAIEIRGIKQKVPNAVGLAVGPIRKRFYGWFLEKGTSRIAAQPWARPAFDAWQKTALEELRRLLWKRVQSAARRLAKRRAKGLA